MKNRTTLFLMELLVMVLVFSLGAAVCLRGLVRAEEVSRETALRDQAAILCRSGAETLKACRSLPEAAEALGASRQEERWIVHQERTALRLEITPQNAPVPGMGQARLEVFSADGEEPIFSLTVGWQEELP